MSDNRLLRVLPAYDAIIPALNEEANIAEICIQFSRHNLIRHVIVVVDGKTTDRTAAEAKRYATYVFCGPEGGGKGQNIKSALTVDLTPDVILCDADYLGLRLTHISALLAPRKPMVIGVPDLPPWRDDMDMSGVYKSWAWMSGFRRLPLADLQAIDLHGYLTEIQINRRFPFARSQVQFISMNGLIAPWRLTQRRRKAMDDDYRWGEENGVFK